jgi:hypothetical protein
VAGIAMMCTYVFLQDTYLREPPGISRGLAKPNLEG